MREHQNKREVYLAQMIHQFQLARDKSRPGKGAHWTIDQTVGEMFEQGNYRQGRASIGNHRFVMMIFPLDASLYLSCIF